ncbi:M23 family metallopeptidase [Sphingomonas sp. PAMC 26621]|uniref:M23 family metallopeptidase n=1 Tax=Sphingomonas sp. PAMC 26621 TaxID=1112213 RepID=UPI0002893DEC|nr:M23 family metallopeptidase [Sphingomonas sp. PAMC 26621]
MAGVPLALIALTMTACIPQDDDPRRGYPMADSRDRQDTRFDDRYPEDSPPPRRARREPRRYEPRDNQRPYEPQGGYPPERIATLPAPLAAWQASPVTPSARQVAPSVYVVRPGDSLSAIGDRTGAGSDAIARANRLPLPFVVRPGQRLTIPGGRYHRVAAGQTGIAISRAYGIDWSRIIAANDLREPYTLRVGMRVLIPDTTTRSAAAERAAAFTLDIDDIVTGSEPALAANQRPARPSASPQRRLAPTQAIAAPARLTSGFDWPVHGRIVTRFGPGARGERYNGVKIAVPLRTPVLAAADGVVAYAGSGIPQLGGVVIVRHGDGWATVYGHASKLLVQRGQAVRRGQTIAMSGDTGGASRPEVHFEMRKGRTPIDPQRQLPAI